MSYNMETFIKMFSDDLHMIKNPLKLKSTCSNTCWNTSIFQQLKNYFLLGFVFKAGWTYLHQYLEEAHQQKLFEKSVLFALHFDGLSNMWVSLEHQLDHCDHRPTSYRLLETGRIGLKYKDKYKLNLISKMVKQRQAYKCQIERVRH